MEHKLDESLASGDEEKKEPATAAQTSMSHDPPSDEMVIVCYGLIPILIGPVITGL